MAHPALLLCLVRHTNPYTASTAVPNGIWQRHQIALSADLMHCKRGRCMPPEPGSERRIACLHNYQEHLSYAGNQDTKRLCHVVEMSCTYGANAILP